MSWKNFYSVFPTDTRQLLIILIPDLMVDTDCLTNIPGVTTQPSTWATRSKYHRSARTCVEIQTAAVGPGLYHLRTKVGVGTEWSPWMDPDGLKLWLILEHPTMFTVRS